MMLCQCTSFNDVHVSVYSFVIWLKYGIKIDVK